MRLANDGAVASLVLNDQAGFLRPRDQRFCLGKITDSVCHRCSRSGVVRLRTKRRSPDYHRCDIGPLPILGRAGRADHLSKSNSSVAAHIL